MLSLCACTTVGVPVKPEIDAKLKEPCRKLPALVVPLGVDLRPFILANRAQSEFVLAECSGKHQGVLEAVQ